MAQSFSRTVSSMVPVREEETLHASSSGKPFLTSRVSKILCSLVAPLRCSNPLSVSLYPLGPFVTRPSSISLSKNCTAVGEVTFILPAMSFTLAGQPLEESE